LPDYLLFHRSYRGRNILVEPDQLLNTDPEKIQKTAENPDYYLVAPFFSKTDSEFNKKKKRTTQVRKHKSGARGILYSSLLNALEKNLVF
jgi:hypothetical protein